MVGLTDGWRHQGRSSTVWIDSFYSWSQLLTTVWKAVLILRLNHCQMMTWQTQEHCQSIVNILSTVLVWSVDPAVMTIDVLIRILLLKNALVVSRRGGTVNDERPIHPSHATGPALSLRMLLILQCYKFACTIVFCGSLLALSHPPCNLWVVSPTKCNSNSLCWFIDVLMELLRSTWWTVAHKQPTSPVVNMCGPPVKVDRSVLSSGQLWSSVFRCCGPVNLEFTARQSSWPSSESQHFQTSTENWFFGEILMYLAH